MRLAMEFEWSFFAFCLGLSVSAGASQAAEKRGKYHLIRVRRASGFVLVRQPSLTAGLTEG